MPKSIYLLKNEHNVLLNFDFQMRGCGGEFSITAITLSAFDEKSNLIVRKSSASNSAAPGILTLPRREVPRRGIVDIFDSFHSLDATIDVVYTE